MYIYYLIYISYCFLQKIKEKNEKMKRNHAIPIDSQAARLVPGDESRHIATLGNLGETGNGVGVVGFRSGEKTPENTFRPSLIDPELEIHSLYYKVS